MHVAHKVRQEADRDVAGMGQPSSLRRVATHPFPFITWPVKLAMAVKTLTSSFAQPSSPNSQWSAGWSLIPALSQVVLIGGRRLLHPSRIMRQRLTVDVVHGAISPSHPHLVRPGRYRSEITFRLWRENVKESFLCLGIEVDLSDGSYNLVPCCVSSDPCYWVPREAVYLQRPRPELWAREEPVREAEQAASCLRRVQELAV